jgi:hypothetical protein
MLLSFQSYRKNGPVLYSLMDLVCKLHARLANRENEILGVAGVENELAADMYDAAPIANAFSFPQLDVYDSGGAWHFAVPAANGILNQQERRNLRLFR